ncbi:MAG: hypothetical protein ACSHXY_09050 [Alphaproteobacteria bacterium]
MSSEPSSAQKAKLLGIMKFVGPLFTFLMAVVVWSAVGDDIPKFFYGVLLVIAVQEFFIFSYLARKFER